MKARFTELDSIEKLNQVLNSSEETPVLIYKHSSTCGISEHVYDEVSNVDADVNLVVVQKARDISNEITARTGIRHETPQAIILKNGIPIYHASHYDITADEISEKLKV